MYFNYPNIYPDNLHDDRPDNRISSGKFAERSSHQAGEGEVEDEKKWGSGKDTPHY